MASDDSIYLLPLQRIDGRLADGDGWRELAADPARTTVQMDRHGRTPRRALADRAPSLSRARGRARQATWLRPPYQPRKAAGRPAVSCHCHAGGWRFYQRQRQRTERGRERERAPPGPLDDLHGMRSEAGPGQVDIVRDRETVTRLRSSVSA